MYYFKCGYSQIWGELVLGSQNNTLDETNGVNNAVSCYKEAVQSNQIKSFILDNVVHIERVQRENTEGQTEVHNKQTHVPVLQFGVLPLFCQFSMKLVERQ